MSEEDCAAPRGRMIGGTHVFPIRVYYEDTDAIGIVYYANYLKWAERGRTEMLRVLGADHSGVLERTGVAFAVRRCTIVYDAPARLDDDLDVLSRIVDIGGASIGFEQAVHRRSGADKDGTNPLVDGAKPLVRLSLTVFCLNRAGRPVRMPPSVRTVLAAVDDARRQG